MGYRQSDLQPAFEGPGTHPFRIFGYATTDPLEEVLGPAYMRSGGSTLSPGDLIYVRTCPRRNGASGREVGETRVALLMVVGWDRKAMRLRLVQDFGRPEDGASPVRASEVRPAAPALSEAPAELPAPVPMASAPAEAASALPQVSAEPPAPVAARRGRGRPPGSRNKNGAFPGFRAGFR